MGFIPNAIEITTNYGKDYFFSGFFGSARDDCFDQISESCRNVVPSTISSVSNTTPPSARTASSVSEIDNSPVDTYVGRQLGRAVPRSRSRGDSGATELSASMPDELETEAKPVPVVVPKTLTLEGHADIVTQELGCSVKSFFEMFIHDEAEHSLEKFHKSMECSEIEVGKWKDSEIGMSRQLRFRTPIKGVSFGPKSTMVNKTQRYDWLPEEGKEGKEDSEDNGILVVDSSCSMLDIPYGDYFTVEDRFRVLPAGEDKCTLIVSFKVKWEKSTMLKGTIESQTKKDVTANYTNFAETALKKLGGEDKRPTIIVQAPAPAMIGIFTVQSILFVVAIVILVMLGFLKTRLDVQGSQLEALLKEMNLLVSELRDKNQQCQGK